MTEGTVYSFRLWNMSNNPCPSDRSDSGFFCMKICLKIMTFTDTLIMLEQNDKLYFSFLSHEDRGETIN